MVRRQFLANLAKAGIAIVGGFNSLALKGLRLGNSSERAETAVEFECRFPKPLEKNEFEALKSRWENPSLINYVCMKYSKSGRLLKVRETHAPDRHTWLYTFASKEAFEDWIQDLRDLHGVRELEAARNGFTLKKRVINLS